MEGKVRGGVWTMALFGHGREEGRKYALFDVVVVQVVRMACVSVGVNWCENNS